MEDSINTSIHHHLAGMGAAADTAVQAGGAVAQAAAPIVFGTAAAPTALGASVGAILGSTALVLPVVGAVIAGLSFGIEAILHSGCGQTCIITSQWADQAAAQLENNVAAYFAISPPRPKSVQKVAMANFQAIWNRLVELCSQPGLGDAGKNCIDARKDGACHWKSSAPIHAGEPPAGTCWNWWSGFYWPIANDPNVYDDSASATTAVSSAANTVATSISNLFPNVNPYLLLGGGLLAAALLSEAL